MRITTLNHKLNTSNVTNMASMFKGIEVERLDLSTFDTSKVTNMSHMFEELPLENQENKRDQILTLNIQHFDYNKVVDMSYMFKGGTNYSLTSYIFDQADLGDSFDQFTHGVNLEGMFQQSGLLDQFDKLELNTNRVINVSRMFFNSRYKKIGFPIQKGRSFFSSVKNASSMFEGCLFLQYIDLFGLVGGSLVNADKIFKNCQNLTTIRANSYLGFEKQSVSSFEMFLGCFKLGHHNYKYILNHITQKYDPSITDGSGAYIYGIHGQIGYFCSSSIVYTNGNSGADKGSIDYQESGGKHSHLVRLDSFKFITSDVFCKTLKKQTRIQNLIDAISYNANYNHQTITDRPRYTPDRNKEFFISSYHGNGLIRRAAFYKTQGSSSNDLVSADQIKATDLSNTEYFYSNGSPFTDTPIRKAGTVKKEYVLKSQNHIVQSTIPMLSMQQTNQKYKIVFRQQNLNSDDIIKILFDSISDTIILEFTIPTLSLINLDRYSRHNFYYQMTDPNDSYSILTKSRWLIFNNAVYIDPYTNQEKPIIQLYANGVMNFGIGLTNARSMYMYAKYQSTLSCDLSMCSSAITADYMFASIKCPLLNISNFDTTNVTSMSNMFQSCKSLTSLDLSNFNTSNVTNMDNMFYSCESLTSLDLFNFNTSNVTNMDNMFYGCRSLTSLNCSNFDTSNVTSMKSMFNRCRLLTSLDVTNFNTSNVTSMYNMFGDCSSLTSLDLSNFNTSNVIDMGSMFSNCCSLTSLDLSNFDTSNVTRMSKMFYYNDYSATPNLERHLLTSLNLSNFNTSNVTDMSMMFENCYSLTSLDLSSFDISSVITIKQIFYNCISLHTLNIANWNIPLTLQKWDNFFNYSYSINSTTPYECYSPFSECKELKYIVCNYSWVNAINRLWQAVLQVNPAAKLSLWSYRHNRPLSKLEGGTRTWSSILTDLDGEDGIKYAKPDWAYPEYSVGQNDYTPGLFINERVYQENQSDKMILRRRGPSLTQSGQSAQECFFLESWITSKFSEVVVRPNSFDPTMVPQYMNTMTSLGGSSLLTGDKTCKHFTSGKGYSGLRIDPNNDKRIYLDISQTFCYLSSSTLNQAGYDSLWDTPVIYLDLSPVIGVSEIYKRSWANGYYKLNNDKFCDYMFSASNTNWPTSMTLNISNFFTNENISLLGETKFRDQTSRAFKSTISSMKRVIVGDDFVYPSFSSTSNFLIPDSNCYLIGEKGTNIRKPEDRHCRVDKAPEDPGLFWSKSGWTAAGSPID